MIDVDKDYEGDVSDEESGTSEQVKMDKVLGHSELGHVTKNCDDHVMSEEPNHERLKRGHMGKSYEGDASDETSE